jgi:hypothetical protein
VAVGCVLVSVVSAGCSSDPSGTSPTGTSTVAPPPATRAVKDPSIPGIGATREDWDASHTPNPTYNNGAVYGYDPSLPYYLVGSAAAVYIGVSGRQRIDDYGLNMDVLTGTLGLLIT